MNRQRRSLPGHLLAGALALLAACGGGEGAAPAPAAEASVAPVAKRALATSGVGPAPRELFGTQAPPRVDLDGDGQADLLWHDPTGGATVAWLLDGGAYRSGATLLMHPSHRVVGTGDFNGDGKTDLVWYDHETTESTLWLMDGVNRLAGTTLLRGQDFRPIGAPDLNGDGKSDLLWLNERTGEVVEWLMDGITLRDVGTVPGATRLSYSLVALPDLNGDGRTDRIWRDPSTGQTHAGLSTGLLSFSATAALVNDPAIGLEAVVDLNGDGKSDLLWRNAATGEVHAWLMDGLAFAGGATVLQNADYRVVATADLNGDGNGDIVWRHTPSGATVVWHMDGVDIVGGGVTLLDGAFLPVALHDVDGDGAADIHWFNATTRTTSAWLGSPGLPRELALLRNSPFVLALTQAARHPLEDARINTGRTDGLVIGLTTFTVDGTLPDGATVTWQLGDQFIGTGRSITYLTSKSDTQVLTATVRTTSGAERTLSRSVEFWYVLGNSPNLASWPSFFVWLDGQSTVTAQVNGRAVGTLTAPNHRVPESGACSVAEVEPCYNAFRFDAGPQPAGLTSITITSTFPDGRVQTDSFVTLP